MRKQIKAALIGMVLATVVFVATPAKAAGCTECPNGWTSLEYMFVLAGCNYFTDAGGQAWVSCTYIPFKMNMNLQPGEAICESREQAPKPTAVDDRNDGVKVLRTDSR